jgi:hypothetical protein
MSYMFNLADYEPVEVRLEKFIKDFPDFRISTELEVVEATRYIVKAYIYKSSGDSIAWATGYAEETVSSRGVNQTSALENCETSAIGRALANAGYATKGKRPSQQEMQKVAKGNLTPLVLIKSEVVAPKVEAEKDYWTTPFGEQDEQLRKVDAPATIETAVNLVADILGTAKVVPDCNHGPMNWKDGNKNGRAWGGYMCSGYTEKNMSCATLWYELASDGTWKPQKVRV